MKRILKALIFSVAFSFLIVGCASKTAPVELEGKEQIRAIQIEANRTIMIGDAYDYEFGSDYRVAKAEFERLKSLYPHAVEVNRISIATDAFNEPHVSALLFELWLDRESLPLADQLVLYKHPNFTGFKDREILQFSFKILGVPTRVKDRDRILKKYALAKPLSLNAVVFIDSGRLSEESVRKNGETQDAVLTMFSPVWMPVAAVMQSLGALFDNE
jgi:lipoprotein